MVVLSTLDGIAWLKLSHLHVPAEQHATGIQFIPKAGPRQLGLYILLYHVLSRDDVFLLLQCLAII